MWLLTGEDGVTLWTRDGHLIDEPDDGVANGCQTWASFADDWENEYYRVAAASQPPAAAAERVPATADTGAGAGGELEADDEEDDEATHEVPRPEAPPTEETDDDVEFVYSMRVHMAFGSSSGWHGGLCAGVCPKSKRIVFGFDDGDVREFEHGDLNAQVRSENVKILAPGGEDVGMVGGAPNRVGKAECFTYC